MGKGNEAKKRIDRISDEEKLVFELQAQFCKAMAHPKRLMILNSLKKYGELTVSDLVEIIGAPQANISQHLTFLRNQGLVKMRKEGLNVYYSLMDHRIIEACNIIRVVITERIKKTYSMLKKSEISPTA